MEVALFLIETKISDPSYISGNKGKALVATLTNKMYQIVYLLINENSDIFDYLIYNNYKFKKYIDSCKNYKK